MASKKIGRSSEVSTTVPERVPLTLREKLIRTLICPSCKIIYRPPVSTCTIGHSTCYACATRYGSCGVCSAELGSIRNFTLEAQLGLVEVECGIPQCTKVIKASKLYQHLGKCDFRLIHCQVPILMSGGTNEIVSARIDCAAVTPFSDYVHHLQSVHNANYYELEELDGTYALGYDASGHDFLGFHDTISAFTVPNPMKWGDKSFLIHSQLCNQEFTLWVSAMFSEEEASDYTITIQLFREGCSFQHALPKWEIRTHNYHVGENGKGDTGGVKDRVTVKPTLLSRFANISYGRWRWYILINIANRRPTLRGLPEITID